jgi:mono/diheme cytochrome c family protein
MTSAIDSPRRSQKVAIILTVVVGLITTAVAYLGTRGDPQAPVSPPTAPAAAAALPEQGIVLPHDEPELPPGPHQRAFAASCTVCHSTRLALTQPPLPRPKWEEVVHKMVKTYGAPLTPEAEGQAVDYLTAVRGN